METGIQELQLAGFRLGDNLFAIDIMRIKEILTPQKLSSFPVQHDLLDGMINLRGQVIPVLNLRARFGMPPRLTGPGKLIIVSVGGRPVALAVDDLDEVFSITIGDLRPPPDMVSNVGAELLIAVCLWNEQMYLVLHIDELFRISEQQTVQRREGAVW